MIGSVRDADQNAIRNALKILEVEDGVLRVTPDLYHVHRLRSPSRRAHVRRTGDSWRCSSDYHNNEDKPCGHILAVFITQGWVERPGAAPVWRKGDAGRNHALEEDAWRLVPTKFPALLARLLSEALPVIEAPPTVSPTGGRPPAALYGLLYQSIMRVAQRQNLRATQGMMQCAEHQKWNPYGGVSRSTISRFLCQDQTTEVLEKLLAVSTWPAKPYETLVHPDGTGLTQQRFSPYFDERYLLEQKKESAGVKIPRGIEIRGGPGEAGTAVATAIHAAVLAAIRQALDAEPDEGPRRHQWNYVEILWTYRYTMVAALHTEARQFGEAAWLLPLLKRASLMLDVRELGADKAYNAYYIYEYARRGGIEVQIKLKDDADPNASSGARARAYRSYVRSSRMAPQTYKAKSNRRSNAEAGNHAFKAILGDQIYSKHPIAQRNEILCMALAYNLMRLVFLGLEQGIDVNFAGGVRVLQDAHWEDLDELYATMTYLAADDKTRHLAEGVGVTD